MSSRRLFAALVLGDELGARVARAVAGSLGLRPGEAGRDGLRPYAGADLHLTLFFLGAVAADTEDELRDLLQVALEGAPAPVLRLTTGGAFPARGRERILWVGLDEPRPGALADVHGRVSEACCAAGFAADERPWRPHVTAARVRRKRDGSLPCVPEAFYALNLGEEWKPTALSLVESVPRGGPRAYRAVGAFPLGGD